jgi:hypothetical protein
VIHTIEFSPLPSLWIQLQHDVMEALSDDETRRRMANVWLTLLHRIGLQDLQTFGDSTGEVEI